MTTLPINFSKYELRMKILQIGLAEKDFQYWKKSKFVFTRTQSFRYASLNLKICPKNLILF